MKFLLGRFSSKSRETKSLPGNTKLKEVGYTRELVPLAGDIVKSEPPATAKKNEPKIETKTEARLLELKKPDEVQVIPAQNSTSSPPDAIPPQRELIRLSKRMAEFQAFKNSSEEAERQLQTLSDNVAQCRHSLSMIHPYMVQAENDLHRSDAMEEEHEELARRIPLLEHELDRKSKELESAVSLARLAEKRLSDLRAELTHAGQRVFDAEAKVERLRIEAEVGKSDLGYMRSDLANALAQLERQTMARDMADQGRLDMENKYARLAQAEAHARNRCTELELQAEKLRSQLPALVSEQENLQAQLRTANRERAELHNDVMTALDRVAQLEAEGQSLQGQLASASFASRTELEIAQAAVRSAERTVLDHEQRANELQTRLHDAENWKRAAEKQIVALGSDVETARRETSSSSARLAELNLKYMTDLVALDNHREQNVELREKIESLQAENRRLSKFESLYKSSETQLVGMRSRLEVLTQEKMHASPRQAQAMDGAAAAAASAKLPKASPTNGEPAVPAT